MSKVKFELNKAGVRELLQGGEMQSIINSAAEQISANAADMAGGLEFEVQTGTGSSRCWASVKPGSIHAYKKTLKHNIMEKAKRSVSV
ncbi:MAG: hypothetical protein IKF99_17570 [Oscillospiraceae bacterium]|nr:hypothetical protein [Oscillospiraceae bacterium]